MRAPRRGTEQRGEMRPFIHFGAQPTVLASLTTGAIRGKGETVRRPRSARAAASFTCRPRAIVRRHRRIDTLGHPPRRSSLGFVRRHGRVTCVTEMYLRTTKLDPAAKAPAACTGERGRDNGDDGGAGQYLHGRRLPRVVNARPTSAVTGALPRELPNRAELGIDGRLDAARQPPAEKSPGPGPERGVSRGSSHFLHFVALSFSNVRFMRRHATFN